MEFNEKLDISNLVKCAENFYKTLSKALSIESAQDETEFSYQFARSAMIHVFEITVENSWKMIQRWVKTNADNKIQRWVKTNADNKIHEKPKRELFRTAHQCGLISDPKVWWEFYDGRNKTSHTYHEETAEEVYALAKKLAEHLKDFIERLEARV